MIQRSIDLYEPRLADVRVSFAPREDDPHRIYSEIAAAAPREDVVVVSHGGVMLALVRHLTGAWGEGRVARNAEILVAGHDGNGYWTLDAMPGMKRA